VHFTREPTVETVITPREGTKLVVRSSRGASQEEYFVDAVEVVAFGNSIFFRSLEKPKAFLLPVSDYEVLEVREARMALKTSLPVEKKKKEPEVTTKAADQEKQLEKKRERRRQRRRKGQDEEALAEGEAPESKESQSELAKPEPAKSEAAKSAKQESKASLAPDLPPPAKEAKPFTSLLPPPTTLISEKLKGEAKPKKEEDSSPSGEADEPQLVPPQSTDVGGWSPSRLFRRFLTEDKEKPSE